MPSKRVEENRVLDRISNLPNEVIDIILSHVPLQVAVQTSTLSRKWRFHWTRAANLVIDQDFVDYIYRGQEDEIMVSSTYVRIVGNIIVSRTGPIRKFVLEVPYFDNLLDVVNLLIIAVSRHGVQHFILNYDSQYHAEVPSYVFQCTELKRLALVNVERPPPNSGVFSSLLSLELECRDRLNDYFSDMISMCPLLERLWICYNSIDGICYINAPKLKHLSTIYYGHTEFILYNTPNLATVELMLIEILYGYGHQECPDILDLLGAVPKIEKISLSGPVLLEWGVHDVPNMLPAPLEHHSSLMVRDWETHSLAQVLSMFCLINSSPLLQTLDISMDGPYSLPENTIGYLKSQVSEAKNMWSLRNVKVTELMGKEPEIIFIEIILSCCPLLEKLNLSGHYLISSDAELKMMTDITQFPRASTQAKMIYSKSEEPVENGFGLREWNMVHKRVKQGRKLDRISDLPNNVIDIILSRVTLPVAVRTSALSKKWRHHWTRVENLMFCDDFNYHILRGCPGKEDDFDEEVNASTYAGIVGNILLSHSGPIRKFFLRVPDFCGDILDAINLWILAVSRHGVQDLTLDYFDSCYDNEVPSYVFQCTGLKHLSLTNVKNPPHNFEGLSSLLSLDLECDVISGDLLTHIFLNCPLLERLSLSYCDDKCSFAIDASKLKVLCLTCHHHSDFTLKNTPNVSTISLEFYKSRRENRHNKCPNLLDFVDAVPKLEKLTLFSAVLEEWGVQDVPKLLPAPLENHLCLTVRYWNIYSLAQVRSMIYLINSSPTLQTLELDISVFSASDSPPHVTSDYLKSQLREAENLWSLKTVKIRGLKGDEPEMLFIELISSCCPVLEKLYLSSYYDISSDAELKLMTDIMRFRRASTQAEMIYSRKSSCSMFEYECARVYFE
ncbi:unnamed protein product [Rhodiola kirilowii]